MKKGTKKKGLPYNQFMDRKPQDVSGAEVPGLLQPQSLKIALNSIKVGGQSYVSSYATKRVSGREQSSRP
jgi:hypothetical protein